MTQDNRLPSITFDDSSANFILEAFGKTTDSEGYIIEQKTNCRVLTPTGQEIHVEDFGGIKKGMKGAETFLEKDLGTMFKIANREV